MVLGDDGPALSCDTLMPGGPHHIGVKGVLGGVPTSNSVLPAWTTGTLVQATANHAVGFLVQATGVPTPALTITGSLPSGMTFTDAGNGYGVFAGTPTASGTGTVTLHAANSVGTTNQTVTVTVATEPTPNYVIPASIDATGATDVTDQLLAFILSKPSGSLGNPTVITFPAGSNYRVEGRLWLGKRGSPSTPVRDYMVFDGHLGGKITRSLAGAGQPDVLNNDVFTATGCQGLVWYGLEIDGGNTTSEYFANKETQNAIRLQGCYDSEVSNCHIHHTYGDAVYMGFATLATGTRICNGVWVHDNTINNTGRQGVSPCGIRDCVVERNYFHDTRRAAIDMEPIGFPSGSNPATFGVFNVHLLTNQLDNIGLSTFAHKGSGLADTIVIKDNYGTTDLTCFFGSSNFNDGTPGETRYNLWFHDNVFATTNMAWPIPIQRYVGASFRNNTVAVQNRLWTSKDGVYHPIVANHTPPWTTDTRIASPFVETNYCQQVASASNTISPSTGAQKYDSNPIAGGSAISSTPPSAPDVAGRSGGGWTP